ncbi:MAG TPA: c-type cytochrome [Acidobacteriaceae bacterium]
MGDYGAMRKLIFPVVIAATIGAAAYDSNHLHVHAATARTSKKSSQGWQVYGGQDAQDHYSGLSQINRSNVKDLVVAWKYDTGEKGNLETNPIVVGHVLYAFTPKEEVIALDAATGGLLWKFDSGIKGDQPTRAVTYWTDGKESLVFAGIMNFLYALDTATGKPIPNFGEDGRIDLRKGLRGDYKSQSIVMTSPGIIYKDLIITGGRNPETPPVPPGDVRAFDVHTGVLRWRFHTIPHPGEDGYKTWPKDAWKTAGAANAWAGMTVDAKRGIVYVPTGSAVPDFYGGNRLGNDLFADTLLALNAETGKLIWYFQGVHHDLWDRDFPAPPALVTLKRNGKSIDALAQTTKQGWVFVLDRSTGRTLFPIEERTYSASDVPGDISSPTQPYPLAPAPYARELLTADMLTNRTPEAHAWALQQFRTMRSEGPFVPLSVDKPTVLFPGFDGGAEWGGPAVDPRTGTLYVNANDIAAVGTLIANNPSANLGAQTYRSECAVCHGVNRAGSPPDFPPLINIEKRLTSAQIIDTIHHGKGRMPTFPNLQGDTLTPLLAYLQTGGAGSSKDISHEDIVASFPAADKARNSPGAQVYAEHCAICHGDKEEGIPPSFPSLIGVERRLSTQQIADLIHDGKGRMPPFTRLPDEHLKALLQFLRGHEVTIPTESATSGADWMRYLFTGYEKFYDPDGYPAVTPPWGTLSAIDLNTGKYLWKRPLGYYPELAAKGMGKTGTENYGGPIVTAGDLVFIGATIFDHRIRAFDSHTGKLLWQAELPFSAVATPSTYMVFGKQYLVIATSSARDPKASQGAVYVAFALP